MPLITGNWKMNTTVDEAVALASELCDTLDGISDVDVVLCPPFISLTSVAKVLEGSPIKVGAQNMHCDPKGAYTVEVSAAMLRGFCDYVILGHSERRSYFCETDAIVNNKVLAALEAGLCPILCVGEGLEDRRLGREEEVVYKSLTECLKGATSNANLVVAYEPVWAIGTGLAASAEQAQTMAAFIRGLLTRYWDEKKAKGVPILYGGSVTIDNASQLVTKPDIDGALVGGSSLDVNGFTEIVSITQSVHIGRNG